MAKPVRAYKGDPNWKSPKEPIQAAVGAKQLCWIYDYKALDFKNYAHGRGYEVSIQDISDIFNGRARLSLEGEALMMEFLGLDDPSQLFIQPYPADVAVRMREPVVRNRGNGGGDEG